MALGAMWGSSGSPQIRGPQVLPYWGKRRGCWTKRLGQGPMEKTLMKEGTASWWEGDTPSAWGLKAQVMERCQQTGCLDFCPLSPEAGFGEPRIPPGAGKELEPCSPGCCMMPWAGTCGTWMSSQGWPLSGQLWAPRGCR